MSASKPTAGSLQYQLVSRPTVELVITSVHSDTKQSTTVIVASDQPAISGTFTHWNNSFTVVLSSAGVPVSQSVSQSVSQLVRQMTHDAHGTTCDTELR